MHNHLIVKGSLIYARKLWNVSKTWQDKLFVTIKNQLRRAAKKSKVEDLSQL